MRTFLALLLSLALLPAAEWETLCGCKFIPNEYNDGDSFHVAYEGKEFIFRLYFVDTPESEGSLPERVAQQAAWFGITPERNIEIGRYAKQATAQLLSEPFTVRTKWQGALGRSRLPRYYAFITTSAKTDLGSVLVSSGLARAFGAAGSPPTATIAELRNRYDSLQAEAKRGKLGAWGRGPDIRRDEPTNPPLAKPQAGKAQPGIDDTTTGEILADLDPLNRVRSAPTTTSPPPAVQTPAKAKSGKVSINKASLAELQTLPGIGPEFAARIIAARPFRSVADLKKVPGIGPAKFASIAPLVAP